MDHTDLYYSPMSAEEQAAATPVDTPAEVTETANATEETKPKSESAKPKSASSKKAAAPSSKTAKSRSTAAAPKKSGGGGTSGGDKKFEVGDIVLARLKGYPPWRESHDHLHQDHLADHVPSSH